MNYLQRLNELKDKIPPVEWEIFNRFPEHNGETWEIVGLTGAHLTASEAEFISVMRNSLDLWLELAKAAEAQIRALESYEVVCELRDVIAKLKGEKSLINLGAK